MIKNNKEGNRTLIIAMMVLLFLPLTFFIYFFYLHDTTPSPLKHLPMLSTTSLPPFQFQSHNGKVITQDSLLGKIVIADFFFTTCPGICPRMSDNMKLLQDSIMKNITKFQSDIQLVSHTVNPSTDSVPVLADYAKLHGVNPKLWWLVTGEKDSLYNLATKFYKLPAMDLTGDTANLAEPFVHSERFVLLDREGFIRGYYDGTDSAMVAQLWKDLIILDIVYHNKDRRDKRESFRNQ
ncbi:hypothetical protein BH09BAC1_BH09BAC1_13110 [soil metagenome]